MTTMGDSFHRTSKDPSYGSMKTSPKLSRKSSLVSAKSIAKASTKTNSNSSLPKIVEELSDHLTDSSNENFLEGPTVSVEDVTPSTQERPRHDVFMLSKVIQNNWDLEKVKMITSNILFACAILIYFLRNFCNWEVLS